MPMLRGRAGSLRRRGTTAHVAVRRHLQEAVQTRRDRQRQPWDLPCQPSLAFLGKCTRARNSCTFALLFRLRHSANYATISPLLVCSSGRLSIPTTQHPPYTHRQRRRMPSTESFAFNPCKENPACAIEATQETVRDRSGAYQRRQRTQMCWASMCLKPSMRCEARKQASYGSIVRHCAPARSNVRTSLEFRRGHGSKCDSPSSSAGRAHGF